MTEKHITIMICDRCGNEFELRLPGVQTRTCRLGIFVLTNGSGSRKSVPDNRDGLDKDLCELCTDGLLDYLDGGKEAGR